MKIAELRAACGRHGFELERMPVKGLFRLIDRGIGHGVINGQRGNPGFTVGEALAYFREREQQEADAGW
jgi:hypothetical protein